MARRAQEEFGMAMEVLSQNGKRGSKRKLM